MTVDRLSFAETVVSNFSLGTKDWDLINTQNVSKRVSDRSSQSLRQTQKKIFQHLVCGGYYTALSYDVIHDVFVLFTFA